MKIRIILTFALVFAFSLLQNSLRPQTAAAQNPKDQPSLHEIIRNVEKRYEVPGFTANFVQVSTIKAMEISDFASGNIFVKRPGMMRWEYEKPQKQLIITNGDKLWIYKPEDNQVMLGQAPSFFGDGKGAGFLADIKILRRKFKISFAKQKDDRYFILTLVPLEDTIELAEILLSVSKSTYTVDKIVTYNSYGDENRIDLIDSRFDVSPDDSLFTFTIPEGVDILQLE